jgi:hypothetical protein
LWLLLKPIVDAELEVILIGFWNRYKVNAGRIPKVAFAVDGQGLCGALPNEDVRLDS